MQGSRRGGAPTRAQTCAFDFDFQREFHVAPRLECAVAKTASKDFTERAMSISTTRWYLRGWLGLVRSAPRRPYAFVAVLGRRVAPSKLMTRVRFPSPAPSSKSMACLDIERAEFSLKSARGNVRDNKRPDFELHPREQDYEKRGSQGSGPGALLSPKQQAQASREIPFGSMGRKSGGWWCISSGRGVAASTPTRLLK
jgi:hypothetical protein